MLDLLVISLLLCALSFCYLIIRNHTFLAYIPMPPCDLFLGHTMEFSDPTGILNKMINYSIKYGGMLRIYIPPGRPSVLVTDHRVLQQLLTSDKALHKSIAYSFLRVWLGNGLVTNGGQQLKERRRLLYPYFGTANILKNFISVFETHSNILIDVLQKEVENQNLNIFPFMKMYAMDVICESAMGIATNCQQKQNLSYAESIKKLCEVMLHRVIHPWKRYNATYKFTEDYRQQCKALEIVDSFFDKILMDKMKENRREEDENDGGEKNLSFLDLLLQHVTSKSKLTLQDVRDEVNTFMFGGQDTIATSLSFTLYILAKHSDVQEKVLEEQQNLFGEQQHDVKACYSDFQQMKYLEMVIKESLRLFPPIPLISRILSDDIKLDNGIVLPKNLNVMLFIYGCHHNPKYFPEPERFIPERFGGNDVPVYKYFPFSRGYRHCVGKKFALLQLKCCISKIVRNFKLSPSVPEHNLELVPAVTLAARNGIRIAMERRIMR